MNFSADDLKQLQSLGIDPAKAAEQIAWLRSGQIDIKLERPCVLGDGIVQIDPQAYPRLYKAFTAASAAGRLQRFIPASGAASRMFADLCLEISILDGVEGSADRSGPLMPALRNFFDHLPSFAFYADLKNALTDDGHDLQQLVDDGDFALVVRYLLEPSGLSYACLPKGLLAFHASADGARSPFIDHLAEAALLHGLEGRVKLHFTVSEDHLSLFKAQLSAWRETLEQTYGCQFDVSYSTQKASTDSLALDDQGQPLRDAEGRLVLRPGGHGALIENLCDLAGDIILVRNIDNVVPDQHKDANLCWTRLLTGYLLEVQEEQHSLLKALQDQPDDPLIRELVLGFLIDRLGVGVSIDCSSKKLLELLDRPLRVCGMVPNSGEPGGGPFWVRGKQGQVTRQIVEGAQIDKDDTEQAKILAASTHFNPVDMICGVSDWRGRPYDLARFVDPDAVIITSKVQNDKEVRVLELPGLWNGGMAGWHTLFVEMPPEAFNPVKTVFDLLRPAHQVDLANKSGE